MKIPSLDRFIFYLVMLGFLMPILPNIGRNILIGLIAIITLVNFIKKPSLIKPDYKLLILGPLMYLTYVISLFYTDDLFLGIKKLETGVSMILIPIIFSVIPTQTKDLVFKNINKLFSLFIISTAVSFIAFFIFFWNQYGMSLLTHYPTLINNDLGPFRIHPIYLCMNGSVALLFALYVFSNTQRRFKNILFLVISVMVISAFLLLLVKKGSILSLIIAGGYMAFAYKNKFIMSGIILLGFMFTTLIVFDQSARAKFSELLMLGNHKNHELSSTNIRRMIYSCAQDAIPAAGFFGFGVGDAKEVLINCYESQSQELVKSEYNSHNQYFSIILRSGYVGLICFATFISCIVFIMNKQKAYIVIAIILFYLLMMFSENILERENGVVYFCFFTSLLYVSFQQKKTSIAVDA